MVYSFHLYGRIRRDGLHVTLVQDQPFDPSVNMLYVSNKGLAILTPERRQLKQEVTLGICFEERQQKLWFCEGQTFELRRWGQSHPRSVNIRLTNAFSVCTCES